MSYLDFYKTDFGKQVLEKELVYVMQELANCKKILSIGSGPCVLEAGLHQIGGKKVVCLDSSKEMLKECPEFMETVLEDAKKTGFQDEEFDAILFVASLEFIEDADKALGEAKRVLSKKGKVLALVLNPASFYFKERSKKSGSYFNKIKHKNLEKIKNLFKKQFKEVETEYFLGITGEKVFESSDKEKAAILALKGIK